MRVIEKCNYFNNIYIILNFEHYIHTQKKINIIISNANIFFWVHNYLYKYIRNIV